MFNDVRVFSVGKQTSSVRSTGDRVSFILTRLRTDTPAGGFLPVTFVGQFVVHNTHTCSAWGLKPDFKRAVINAL